MLKMQCLLKPKSVTLSKFWTLSADVVFGECNHKIMAVGNLPIKVV